MPQLHLSILILGYLWFQIRRVFFQCVENLICYLDGTHAKIVAAKSLQNYAYSARLCQVKDWKLFDPWTACNTKMNLITEHECFIHPEYILKDEVSFYCFTDNEAWFVEAPSGVEVWRSKYSAFHKIAQHEYAKKVIKMPLSSFYQLADQLEEVKETLIFIEFVPRSGSTLLGQIFEETGDCVNYSEPHFLNLFFVNQDSEKGLKQLRAVLKMYCKPRSEPTSAFVFKYAPTGRSIAPLLHKLHPAAKFLYLTRNAVTNIKSMRKIAKQVPAGRILGVLPKWLLMKVNNVTVEKLALPFDDYTCNLIAKGNTRYLFTCLVYIGIHYSYLRRRSSAPEFAVIKYEDLLSNQEVNVKTMFDFCGFSESLVAKGVQAFAKDSQAGSPLSMQTLQQVGCSEESARLEDLDDLRKLGKHWGFTDILADLRLPGTITSP